MRLTMLYGGLFLVLGSVLAAVTYILLAHEYTVAFFIHTGKISGSSIAFGAAHGSSATVPSQLPPGVAPPTITLPGGITAAPANGSSVTVVARTGAHLQSVAALHELLIGLGIALAFMAVLSLWLGWIVAGRVLRPLRTMADTARDISASNLHRRLTPKGPDDELKRLGTTFDALLERLESAFEAQRQFVANASHELRTPLTLNRTLVEVALADPDATVESLRTTLGQLLAADEQQERLIEALLTLSRSQRGLERREPLDLAALGAEVLAAREPEIRARGLRLERTLEPAATTGDQRLVERLIANLVDNAIRHNVPSGYVLVTTGTRRGRALVAVENSGSVVPAADLERMLEPFERLDAARSSADSLGLGLSIVRAIAVAHGASLEVSPRPEGGLVVRVAFPVREAPAEPPSGG
jgi:signal transduction histidine kinase